MHIDRIDLFHVRMPLIYPWRTAYGEDADIESVLCRLTSGSVEAWGESSPLAAPCYSPEWAGGIFAVCKQWLAPQLLHQDVTSGEDLQKRLSLFKGNSFAKAALDTAWWNLQSRLQNRPLHQLLGASRDVVQVGADFGVMDSIDDLVKAIGTAVDDKFPRVKLKFRPGWDLPMLKAVRQEFPKEVFHIDCNSGYRIADLPLFQAVDEFNLAMIEQPLRHDDVIEHAELQRQIKTPVCLDETISHPDHAVLALRMKSCQYVNIKPGRIGGLTNAVRVHDLCELAGIPCWVGGMLESATGAGLCVSLAMLDNFTYPPDIFPSSRFYRVDLSDPPLELERDASGVPSVRAPHRIADPHPERLAKLTVQQATLK